jgi:hypothetical protein
VVVAGVCGAGGVHPLWPGLLAVLLEGSWLVEVVVDGMVFDRGEWMQMGDRHLRFGGRWDECGGRIARQGPRAGRV